MSWIECEIALVQPLSNTIIQLHLAAAEHDYIPYYAGQYLELAYDKKHHFFSIANAALGAHYYECHIRHDCTQGSNQDLLNYIQNHHKIALRLPFGEVYLEHLHPDKAIIFIAGGVGFAQIKAMIEALMFANDSRIFECYWGVKSKSDLYWQAQLQEWQKHVTKFKHLDFSITQNGFTLIDKIIQKHPKDLKNYQFVLSGPFDMSFHFRDKLIEQGIDASCIYSDAFAFEHKGD